MNKNLSRKNCPVKREIEEVERLSGEMYKSLRQFRQDMMNCPVCPHYDGCPVLAEFHTMVDQVILEIYGEWDLK